MGRRLRQNFGLSGLMEADLQTSVRKAISPVSQVKRKVQSRNISNIDILTFSPMNRQLKPEMIRDGESKQRDPVNRSKLSSNLASFNNDSLGNVFFSTMKRK